MQSTDIRTRLLWGFGSLLTMMLLLGGIAIRSSSKQAQSLRELTERNLAVTHDLSTAERALWEMRFGLPGYILGGAEQRAKVRADTPKWMQIIDERIRNVSKLYAGQADVDALLTEWHKAYNLEYLEARPTFLELIDANKLEEAKAFRAKVTNPAAAHAVATLAKLIDLAQHQADEQERAVVAASASEQTQMMLLLGVALAVGIVLAYLVRRSISQAMDRVVALNESLADQVAARTRSLQLVLDSTGDGLLAVGLDGKLRGEHTRAVEAWFGNVSEGALVWEYIAPESGPMRESFQLGFAQLTEDVLPFELCADQMPRRVRHGNRELALHYKQIVEHGSFSGVLVQLSDVTERLQFEAAQREAHEFAEIVSQLLRDKSGFRDGVRECQDLLEKLTQESHPTLILRTLHTLKGTSATLGFHSFAELCHLQEQRIAAEGETFGAAERTVMAERFRHSLRGIATFFRADEQHAIEIRMSEHSALLERLHSRRDYPELIKMVELWLWTPVAEKLVRLQVRAERIANRLGKAVDIELVHDDSRLPPSALAQFWPSMIHIIRNAIDHGIEPMEVRAAAGKTGPGKLRLSCQQSGADLVIEVADDGPGIDIDALRAAAVKRGLPVTAATPLEDLVFADGVSSREVANDISGRGVGMGAVRAACEADGGSVRISSLKGKGTTISFRFPLLAEPIARAS